MDRIYYEMANFEIKHEDPDLAIEYLKSSIASSVNNPRQKGLGYLKLGELYYDLYKNYELAQAYYDSTVAVLPQDEERFEEIRQRSEILTDFVKQLKTIQLQDSLITLSEMNKSDLQQLLDNVVAEEERMEREQKKEARRLTRQTTSTSTGSADGRDFANPFGMEENSPAEGDTWYFYNLAAVSRGRSQFLTKWGQRVLEDNWRRSQRQTRIAFQGDDILNTVDTISQSTERVTFDGPDTEDRTAALMATIPFSEDDKAASLKQIEDAYFQLGSIYNFQLEEDENAIETYQKLITRFPGSEYEPETLYLLYLILKPDNELAADEYKQKLIELYPKTIYAKLAINPNYREESNETAQRLQRLYKIAYDYYLQEDFSQAKLLVSRGLQQYPDNAFSDQLKILGILIDGKIEGQYKYQYELQQFIENNPESRFLDYANSLLEASRDFKTKELQRKGAKYISYFDQPHFFIFVYPNLGSFSEIIPALIENYIEKELPNEDLKTGNLSLNEGFSLVLVNKFQTKDQAMEFYENFNASDIMLPQDEKVTFEHFIITEDNFQILYQTKKTEDYQKFFEEKYLKP